MSQIHKKCTFEDISNNIIYSDLLDIEYNPEYQVVIDILDKCFIDSSLNKDKTYTRKGKYYYHYFTKKNSVCVDSINVISPLSKHLDDMSITKMVKFYLNRKYDMNLSYVTSYRFGFYDISRYV